MKGIIYKIESNGLIYIGSTTRSIKKRIRTCAHFAFTKYNFDCYNYKVEILDELEFLDKNELFKLEGQYMLKYNCVNKTIPKGYGKDKQAYDKQRYIEKQEEKVLRQRKYYKKNLKEVKNRRKTIYDYKKSWSVDSRIWDTYNLLNVDPSLFH